MSKNKKDVTVNLTLLKKLVGELETVLAGAEAIKANPTDDNIYEYVIEMSKCTGLAAGLIQEATLIIGDISYVTKANTSGTLSKDESLASLLGTLKGGSGMPGSN